MSRRLDPEEQQLWNKVVATVRPMHGRRQAPPVPQQPVPQTRTVHVAGPAAPAKPHPLPPGLGTTLDGSWDRRISRGLVHPDMVVDLHGHNLANAYDLLDRRLAQAIESKVRVLLLVTGKPPAGGSWPTKRGVIRAAVGDWLAASRHSGHIASVRSAHPRHGGQGALYIILRRERRARSG